MQYKIEGAPLPAVICQMEPGETIITEKREHELDVTEHEYGNHQQRRVRQSPWAYVCRGIHLPEQIYGTGRAWHDSLCFKLSGRYRAIEITPDRPVIVQKSAFLAGEAGVELLQFSSRKNWAADSSEEKDS